MTLKPFGSSSGKASPLKPFGRMTGKEINAGTTLVGRTPKLAGKPWNERLKYLVQRGYIITECDGWWLICDRFSNPIIDETGMTRKFNNHVTAQQYADKMNNKLFQLRLKELTGHV
jgi:hypothetical protein